MIPKIVPMDTPKTRAEFEQRFHCLADEIRGGRLRFPPSMGESLLKVRLLPNRRLDFLSVNETARLHANMTSQRSLFQLPLEATSKHGDTPDE